MERPLFQEFVRLAYEKAGIAIRPGKEALVSARVAKRQRALAIESAERYLEFLQADGTGEELNYFLDVISTHFTSFFRELDHFAVLTEEVKRRSAWGQRKMRLWSAACSTGEEPYSMAMTVLDVPEAARLDLKILATDISLQSLDEGRAGVYPASRIEPVPRSARYSGSERPAWRMNHAGTGGTASPRHADRKGLVWAAGGTGPS
jgi:chemotaxis protein methyltransferase CheR